MNDLEKQMQYMLYKSEDATVQVNALVKDETIWLTQKAMGELFGCSSDNISFHLKNIFSSGELVKDSVTEKFSATASDGKSYKTQFYNLDAIISVGYRVNSQKATQFRIWATKVLKEFMIKGFVLDDYRLKQGKDAFGKDYFDELLERIREIRASERRAYQKITDIFAQCSYDYDPASRACQNFYSFVQNKLHVAVTGLTAAELIFNRVDANKDHMGLTTWKDAPSGKIYLSDTKVAKNYLREKELQRLNRLVTMFIDRAEMLAEDHEPMSMNDWVKELDRFLEFNKQTILQDFGSVTRKQAEKKARNEYEKYRPKQDKNYISDFDEAAKSIIKPK